MESSSRLTSGRIVPLSSKDAAVVSAAGSISTLADSAEALVLNSLDAGASSIRVSLSVSSFRVRVEDDGCGILPDSFAVLGVAHASSRDVGNPPVAASSAAGVSRDHGYGKRGSALASLGQLGRLEVTSRASPTEPVTGLVVERGVRTWTGRIAASPDGSQPLSGRTGTIVTASNLFVTLPVRRSAIGQSRTGEVDRIKEMIIRLSLVHPCVSFALHDDDAPGYLLRIPGLAPSDHSTRARFKQLYGSKLTDLMLDLDYRHETAVVGLGAGSAGGIASPSISITGFVGFGHHSRDLQFTTVNGRYCKSILLFDDMADGILQHAARTREAKALGLDVRSGDLPLPRRLRRVGASSSEREDNGHPAFFIDITFNPPNAVAILHETDRTLVSCGNPESVRDCLKASIWRSLGITDAASTTDGLQSNPPEAAPFSSVHEFQGDFAGLEDYVRSLPSQTARVDARVESDVSAQCMVDERLVAAKSTLISSSRFGDPPSNSLASRHALFTATSSSGSDAFSSGRDYLGATMAPSNDVMSDAETSDLARGPSASLSYAPFDDVLFPGTPSPYLARHVSFTAGTQTRGRVLFDKPPLHPLPRPPASQSAPSLSSANRSSFAVDRAANGQGAFTRWALHESRPKQQAAATEPPGKGPAASVLSGAKPLRCPRSLEKSPSLSPFFSAPGLSPHTGLESALATTATGHGAVESVGSSYAAYSGKVMGFADTTLMKTGAAAVSAAAGWSKAGPGRGRQSQAFLAHGRAMVIAVQASLSCPSSSASIEALTSTSEAQSAVDTRFSAPLALPSHVTRLGGLSVNRGMLSRLQVIGQLDRKFILSKVDLGGAQQVVILDQHAIDERIRVEAIEDIVFSSSCRRPSDTGSGMVSSEYDLSLDGLDFVLRAPSTSSTAAPPGPSAYLKEMPLAQSREVELSHRELQTARQCDELLRTWGFGVKTQLHHAAQAAAAAAVVQVEVTSLPMLFDILLDTSDLRDFLSFLHSSPLPSGVQRALAKDLASGGASALGDGDEIRREAQRDRLLLLLHAAGCIPPAVRRVINSKACRGAVMFGDELTQHECRALIQQLQRTRLPFQCAHGRPSMAPLATALYPV